MRTAEATIAQAAARVKELAAAQDEVLEGLDHRLSGPREGVRALLVFPTVNILATTFLYGHAGRFTAQNCGFRRGQGWCRGRPGGNSVT
jgi:hypothetical protein